MGDDTPAHVAQVSVESASLPSPDAGSHDALEETDLRIRDNTGRSNDSGITGSTSTTSRSNSLCTDASDASVTTAAVSPCDPLAAGAVGSMHMVLDEHPLSPSVSLGTSKRTSYFRTSVHPGISPVANVIFPEEDDEDTPGEDGVDRQLEAQARPSMEGPALAASPVNTDRTPSSSTSPLPTIFRLPHAPHRLSAKAVDERLREVVPNEIRGVILAQELAKQLEVVQRELDDLKELQTARENGLIALLKENGNVSESLISRTLVRAKAESGETRRIERSDRHGWKIVLSNVGKDVQISRSSPPKRVCLSIIQAAVTMLTSLRYALQLPLDEDLQDAMFENDFKETARSISPSLPITNKSSPQIRQTAASSPTPVLAASLHERRNRQPSQSLSARLFGGFTPPATSHLSPSSDSFQAGAHPPLSASSGEGSPGHVAAPTNSKKSRANSIHSVASASSHQSSRGISGWTGSLWSWNRSGKSRHFSDNEDDDEEPPSEDESTPIVTEAFTQARAAAKQTQQEDKDKTVKGRPRTLSKGSSNSASTKSCGTTAATSFSSHAVTQIEQQSEDEHSGKLRTSPSATSTLTMEDPDKTDRSSGKGEGPVKTLLGRRPSALHPDAALSAHSVTIPVTAASSPRTSLSGKFEPLQTSTSILQSLNLQIREKTLEHDERDAPLHFRAVSQSASTIGKSSGRSPANELFRAPNKVSDNISEWTYRLLSSFQTPVVMPDIATIASTPTSADMARTSSKSPSTSRSTSPMISQSKGKATLSPATVLNDSSTKTVRLSVSSPSSQDATFGSFASNAAAEAMPLAPSEVHKQKGYIASAKGTIGRALGLSGSSSGKASSSPSGASQKSRYGKTRSNSLKAVIEPALTVPSTFTSFASPSSGALPSTTSPVQPDSHSHRVPAATPLEMGTIVAPEAKPPTLSSDLTDQMKDGPLVDRFGFVYDVKVGMKLLKEYRKKQEVGEETVISLDPPAEVNVEDLREAIGPSPSATPGIETALRGAALQLGRDKSTESKDAERQSLDMISEHETMQPPAQLPSNHSIRRLLSQLGEMNESVEQSQKEAWDHFIKRRRKKAQRPPKDDDAAAASKARKKRMTIVEAPLSIATADLNDDNADNQFSDNLVGVASMGADKQDDKTFRHLVRSGIPIAYRPSVSLSF